MPISIGRRLLLMALEFDIAQLQARDARTATALSEFADEVRRSLRTSNAVAHPVESVGPDRKRRRTPGASSLVA